MDNKYHNSRLFLGNLASESTSEQHLRQIFSAYGNVEEVIIRKSFGFIQFSNQESAERARVAEHRRNVGGLFLDIKFATGERKGEIELSKKSNKRPRKQMWDDRDQPLCKRAKDERYKLKSEQILQCKILYIGSVVRDYAHILKTAINDQLGLTVERYHSEPKQVTNYLERSAIQRVPYVYVLNASQIDKKIVDFYILKDKFPPQALRNIVTKASDYIEMLDVDADETLKLIAQYETLSKINENSNQKSNDNIGQQTLSTLINLTTQETPNNNNVSTDQVLQLALALSNIIPKKPEVPTNIPHVESFALSNLIPEYNSLTNGLGLVNNNKFGIENPFDILSLLSKPTNPVTTQFLNLPTQYYPTNPLYHDRPIEDIMRESEEIQRNLNHLLKSVNPNHSIMSDTLPLSSGPTLPLPHLFYPSSHNLPKYNY